MNRREFLIASAGTAAAIAAPSTSTTTVLYNDSTVKLDKIRPDAKDLWVRAADLPRINEFELKPQGACRADMCIPVAKDSEEWRVVQPDRLLARRSDRPYVIDSGVWSFGDIPVMRGSFYEFAHRARISRFRTAKARWSTSRIFAARKC